MYDIQTYSVDQHFSSIKACVQITYKLIFLLLRNLNDQENINLQLKLWPAIISINLLKILLFLRTLKVFTTCVIPLVFEY